MEAPSVIRALKRFLARRGIIKMFISDNFRSFIAEDLKRFSRTLEIEWSYIFLKSPWWGGFYERIIRTVKSSLRKTLGRARLNYEEMETVTSEIGMIINSRPLTYIQDDVEEVLTPHLIVGRRLLSRYHHTATEPVIIPENGEAADMRKRLKYLNEVLTIFQGSNMNIWQN